MPHDEWRMGFHFMPPTGWVNDPNGLCQFDGTYHVYHQYNPEWPDGVVRWGHFTSTDLAHWTHHGVAVERTLPEEDGGVWSGGAFIEDGVQHIFYTANRKLHDRDDYDYVLTGRTACQCHMTSTDGFGFSPKEVLLRNEDYPANVGCHVRDPKVWRQDGAYRMMLGARRRDDVGEVLLYRSDDLVNWTFDKAVTSDEKLGYMWECPDRIELDGHEFLGCCPQGEPAQELCFQNHDNSGYFPLEGTLLETAEVKRSSFVEWDCGFDFYAPQSFVDESGRTIMVGWMSEPVHDYDTHPDGLAWNHCLTVPRLLTLSADGRICQQPVPELDVLHGERIEVSQEQALSLSEHRCDLRAEGIEGSFSVVLDDALELSFSAEEGMARLRFLAGGEAVAAGRTERVCPLSELRDVRVLVDSSAVEVFLNGGAVVFGTRWFPRAEELSVQLEGQFASACAWPMGDGMASTWQ